MSHDWKQIWGVKAADSNEYGTMFDNCGIWNGSTVILPSKVGSLSHFFSHTEWPSPLLFPFASLFSCFIWFVFRCYFSFLPWFHIHRCFSLQTTISHHVLPKRNRCLEIHTRTANSSSARLCLLSSVITTSLLWQARIIVSRQTLSEPPQFRSSVCLWASLCSLSTHTCNFIFVFPLGATLLAWWSSWIRIASKWVSDWVSKWVSKRMR